MGMAHVARVSTVVFIYHLDMYIIHVFLHLSVFMYIYAPHTSLFRGYGKRDVKVTIYIHQLCT